MKPRILVDMDGPLANLEQGFLDCFRQKFPQAPFVPLTERRSFYQVDDYPATHEGYIRGLMAEPGFFEDLPVIPGSIKALNQMLSLEWEVVICSSPLRSSRTCLSEKDAWILRHLGPEWRTRLILTHDKTWIRGDILIDDRPQIFGELVPEWTHVLYDYPYNQLEDKPRLTWANWQEILETLLLEPES